VNTEAGVDVSTGVAACLGWHDPVLGVCRCHVLRDNALATVGTTAAYSSRSWDRGDARMATLCKQCHRTSRAMLAIMVAVSFARPRCTLPKIHTLHLPQAHVMSPDLRLTHLTYPHRQNDHVWVVHHHHRAPVHYPRRLRGTEATPTSFKRALRARCA